MIIDVNIKATFKRAIFMENPKWLAIEFIFKVEGRTLKHKFFGATDYKKRKEFNENLRHLYEVITGGNYEEIPYSNHFDTVSLSYCNRLNKHRDTEFYIKTLPNPSLKYINLGFEQPFISLNPYLQWGELEELRLEAWNEKCEEDEANGDFSGQKVYLEPKNLTTSKTPTPKMKTTTTEIPANLKPIEGTVNKPIGKISKKNRPNDDDIPF